MLLSNKFDLIFSLKLAFWYAIAKLKFVRPILPKKLRNRLPIGWNFHMITSYTLKLSHSLGE